MLTLGNKCENITIGPITFLLMITKAMGRSLCQEHLLFFRKYKQMSQKDCDEYIRCSTGPASALMASFCLESNSFSSWTCCCSASNSCNLLPVHSSSCSRWSITSSFSWSCFSRNAFSSA